MNTKIINGQTYTESEDVEGEFILLLPKTKFEVNEDCNYYTIRQHSKKEFFDQGWSSNDERTLRGAGAGHGEFWRQAFQDCKEIPKGETVEVFYDELLQDCDDKVLDDVEFNPPKKWLKMDIVEYVRFVLNDLDFYRLSAKKKKFFSIFLNYYIQKYEGIRNFSKKYHKLEWDNNKRKYVAI